MQEQEGVIRFDLRFTAGAPVDAALLAELNAWRTILFRLGLVGRDPQRYGGIGYGNVSRRLANGRFADGIEARAARQGWRGCGFW